MIVLLTDYGYDGPYIGQLKAKIFENSPTATVIDLMHDLPIFNIDAAASLIPAITKEFPNDTIFICIVDPGVGSNRKAILIKTERFYFVGPDNGIFNSLCITNKYIEMWEILWRPENLSISFHGRDLFVPIACQLFNKELNFETDLRQYPVESGLTNFSQKNQIIYFDGFGNAITSIQSDGFDLSIKLKIDEIIISFNKVFSKVPIGHYFWYNNSMGLVEIACNQESVKQKFNLSIGQVVEFLKS